MHSFLLPDDPWRHIKAFTCDPGRYPHPIARLYPPDGRQRPNGLHELLGFNDQFNQRLGASSTDDGMNVGVVDWSAGPVGLVVVRSPAAEQGKSNDDRVPGEIERSEKRELGCDRVSLLLFDLRYILKGGRARGLHPPVPLVPHTAQHNREQELAHKTCTSTAVERDWTCHGRMSDE
jgi:hypothetical protein